jgi:hypothetical protein
MHMTPPIEPHAIIVASWYIDVTTVGDYAREHNQRIGSLAGNRVWNLRRQRFTIVGNRLHILDEPVGQQMTFEEARQALSRHLARAF